MSKKQPRGVYVAIAVIERRGSVLICRRRKQDSFGGFWEFPGGKRKSKESWAACVRREVREELGVRVSWLAPYGKLYHRLRQREAFFRVFRCRITGGQPRPLAAQALKWVPLRRLLRYRFPPANKPLLKQLRRLSQASSSGIISGIHQTRRQA